MTDMNEKQVVRMRALLLKGAHKLLRVTALLDDLKHTTADESEIWATVRLAKEMCDAISSEPRIPLLLHFALGTEGKDWRTACGAPDTFDQYLTNDLQTWAQCWGPPYADQHCPACYAALRRLLEIADSQLLALEVEARVARADSEHVRAEELDRHCADVHAEVAALSSFVNVVMNAMSRETA